MNFYWCTLLISGIGYVPELPL